MEGEIFPVIAVFDGNEWNTIPFPDAQNHYWSHVYRPYSDDNMYAISQASCGDPGAIYIYRSADRGRSWTVSTIRKPYYLAYFFSLRIEPDGSGEIIVRTYNDADPIGGHHVYRTTDLGDTWSEPEFSPTILQEEIRPGYYSLENVPIPQLMEEISDLYAPYGDRQ
jgi:hypothetical protein